MADKPNGVKRNLCGRFGGTVLALHTLVSQRNGAWGSISSSTVRAGYWCRKKQKILEIHSYEYHAVYSPEWSENEVNHILVGEYDEDPTPNPSEIADYQWLASRQIKNCWRSSIFAPWVKVKFGMDSLSKRNVRRWIVDPFVAGAWAPWVKNQ